MAGHFFYAFLKHKGEGQKAAAALENRYESLEEQREESCPTAGKIILHWLLLGRCASLHLLFLLAFDKSTV